MIGLFQGQRWPITTQGARVVVGSWHPRTDFPKNAQESCAYCRLHQETCYGILISKVEQVFVFSGRRGTSMKDERELAEIDEDVKIASAEQDSELLRIINQQ